eukprot:7898307-Pyramimonas_sp.AAC.1
MSFDGTPLSTLAQKVTKVRVTGNVKKDNVLKSDRLHKIKVIDAMEKKPKICAHLATYIDQTDFDEDAYEEKDETQWTGKYKSLGSLPDWFLDGWLIDYGKKHKLKWLTAEYVCDLRGVSPETVVELVSFALQVIPSQGSPAPMAQQTVTTLMFDTRSDAIGNYLRVFFSRDEVPSPTQCLPEYGLYGCFRTDWDKDDYLVSVEHITGAEVMVPKHLEKCITKSYTIKDNHMNHLARLVLGPSVHYLKDFFFEEYPDIMTNMPATGKKATWWYALATDSQSAI